MHIVASADYTEDHEIFLNAYFDKVYKTNPLPADERTYPIAFDYRFNYNYYLNLQLPNGYTIEYMPESRIISLDQNMMLFSTLLASNESKSAITLTSKFQSNKNNFEASQYGDMRTLIETMIAEQNKNIILKKVE